MRAFGERRLHEVSRTDVKRLIAQLVAQGLKKRTIHNILTPLKEAYTHAMDDGLVNENPVAHMGRFIACPESADSHIDPLTVEEVRAMLASAQRYMPLYYPLLLCAVRTGMRLGELIGLQWTDVDFRGRFIQVRRAVVRRQLTTTKSHKIRRVDMSPQLAQVLQRLKETRQIEASLKGQPLLDVVFKGSTGKRVNDDVLRKVFAHCLDRAGLRRVRFHDLRHTFASLLIQKGANPKYIQEQLGHGSISITLDVYSHLFQGDHRHQVWSLDDPQDGGVMHEALEANSATQAQPTAQTTQASESEYSGILDEEGVGEVREWPNRAVSKTVVPQGTVGSNPTLSASKFSSFRNCGKIGVLHRCPDCHRNCHPFLFDIPVQMLSRELEVFFTRDIVTVENRSSFVPSDFHGDRFWYPGSYEISRTGPPQIVKQ